MLWWKDANEALTTCRDIWPLTFTQPISLNPSRQLQMVSLRELSADTTSEWFNHFCPHTGISLVEFFYEGILSYMMQNIVFFPIGLSWKWEADALNRCFCKTRIWTLTDTGSTGCRPAVGSQMCPFNSCYLLYPCPDSSIWGACGVGRVVDTAVVWVLMLRMFLGAANQLRSSTGKMIPWLCRDSLRNVFWPGWRNVHLIRRSRQILFYLACSPWILLPDLPQKCLFIIRWEVLILHHCA